MIGHLPYIFCVVISVIGLYGVAVSDNYIKKLMSLGILQSGVIMFFLSLGNVKNGRPPILNCIDHNCMGDIVNPLPQVLMLTAIVVGVATLAVGLSIALRVKKEIGSLEESELVQIVKDGK